MLLDFATLSKTLGDLWQTVPEKEKAVCYIFASFTNYYHLTDNHVTRTGELM